MGRWVGCKEKVFGSLASNKESVIVNTLCVGNWLHSFCREIGCTLFVGKSVRNHTSCVRVRHSFCYSFGFCHASTVGLHTGLHNVLILPSYTRYSTKVVFTRFRS